MVASLPVFALFGRRERRSRYPVIEPSLLRNRAFGAGLGFECLKTCTDGVAVFAGMPLDDFGLYRYFLRAAFGVAPYA